MAAGDAKRVARGEPRAPPIQKMFQKYEEAEPFRRRKPGGRGLAVGAVERRLAGHCSRIDVQDPFNFQQEWPMVFDGHHPGHNWHLSSFRDVHYIKIRADLAWRFSMQT